MPRKEKKRLTTWAPRISRTRYGWSVDWWEKKRHKQRRFKTEEAAQGYAAELVEEREARAAGELEQRKIVRANVRRGDVVVDLLNLPPGDKMAVAQALEILRASGGSPVDLATAAREYAERHLSEFRATIGDVLARHLEDLRSLGRSASTIRQRKDLCGRLAAMVGPNKRISTIGRPEIAEWISSATPGSRGHYYTAAAALFRWAWQRGYIGEYPMAALPKPEVRRRGEAAILTPSEVRALLSTAMEYRPSMVSYIALGVFAGLRPESELSHLQWEDIDMDDRRIYSKSLKTGRTRPVPISDNLAAWLDLVPLQDRHGRAAKFSRRFFRAIQEKAKVKVGQDVLRHTRCSYRLALVKDPGIVAAEGGHSLGVLQRHYANLRLKEAEVREFWGIMPQ